MTVNKRNKFSRMRASHTHAWAAKKKHRSAGSRGGRGMAGTGKRADQKKPSIWKEDYFGKFGFKKKGFIEKIVSINLEKLDISVDAFVKHGSIKKEGDAYACDLGKLGFNKLLGKGKVNRKFKISVQYASARAIGKIKAAGGEVVAGKVQAGNSVDNSSKAGNTAKA